MSAVTIDEAWPGFGSAFTVAELDRMPDDGHRYELFDGVLVVSPRPTTIHQLVMMRLASNLDRVCPADLCVVPEPTVQLDPRTEFDPDLVVVPSDEVGARSSPRRLYSWSRSGRRAPRYSTSTARRPSTRSCPVLLGRRPRPGRAGAHRVRAPRRPLLPGGEVNPAAHGRAPVRAHHSPRQPDQGPVPLTIAPSGLRGRPRCPGRPAGGRREFPVPVRPRACGRPPRAGAR